MSEDSHRERKIPHAGTYTRNLPVSIERLYENAIDWEHLPHLHRSTFSRIECLDAGDWGFRARVWTQPYDERRSSVIELRLDRELRRRFLRWITTTLDGPGPGTEIWTHAFAQSEHRTDIVVDFFVPGLDASRRVDIGRRYISLYTRLYDEDVSMMSERQAQLDTARPRATADPAPIVLGSLAEVRARLPITIEIAGRNFRIVESDGDLLAYSTLCPHRLGPLGDGDLRGAIVECPWHGYRYNIRTRQCVSAANLTLAPAPQIIVGADSRVTLEFLSS